MLFFFFMLILPHFVAHRWEKLNIGNGMSINNNILHMNVTENLSFVLCEKHHL